MRVMVVDDSPVSRVILERMVVDLGHEVVVARDGTEAWDRFGASDVDVLISDWLMPGIDGLELCRRVRSARRARYTYVIVLTAQSKKAHIVEAMEAGADDFLVKPLDRTGLQAALIAATRVTAVHRELAVQRAELERLNALLSDDARRDALTLVGNRRRLDEDLRTLISHVERSDHRYVAALIDLDRFKLFNDAFGHLAGDDALRAVAAAMGETARRGDALYRYGGEEFLVLFPDQGLAGSQKALDRLRRAVEALAIPHPDNTPAGVVTISAGIATLDAADLAHLALTGADAAADWLARADAALYRAKAAGRNQIAIDGDERTAAA
jgi:two-component system chemotaxis response regulator CheY